jgi:hypothetical protein
VLGADQRAELGGRIVLQAVLDAGHRLAQAFDEALVDAVLHVQAAGRGAVLPGVVEAEGADAFDGGIDVGIVEHDHRGLAAQFHVHALHAVGGG